MPAEPLTEEVINRLYGILRRLQQQYELRFDDYRMLTLALSELTALRAKVAEQESGSRMAGVPADVYLRERDRNDKLCAQVAELDRLAHKYKCEANWLRGRLAKLESAIPAVKADEKGSGVKDDKPHTCNLASGMNPGPCEPCQDLYQRGEHWTQKQVTAPPKADGGETNERSMLYALAIGSADRAYAIGLAQSGSNEGALLWEREQAYRRAAEQYGNPVPPSPPPGNPTKFQQLASNVRPPPHGMLAWSSEDAGDDSPPPGEGKGERCGKCHGSKTEWSHELGQYVDCRACQGCRSCGGTGLASDGREGEPGRLLQEFATAREQRDSLQAKLNAAESARDEYKRNWNEARADLAESQKVLDERDSLDRRLRECEARLERRATESEEWEKSCRKFDYIATQAIHQRDEYEKTMGAALETAKRAIAERDAAALNQERAAHATTAQNYERRILESAEKLRAYEK